MTCEQAELRMAELLAGEIAPEERASLERHLLDCATCRGDFELARAGARVEWADVAVPREVVESTLASFREPSPVVRLFRWATAAAAAVAVAALLIASSRAPKSPETVAAACAAERPAMLATMQPDAGVGALVCQDEEGRPVGELGLKSHEVSVEILDGVAKTTVEENFENHTARRLEGTFNFPLPADASISRLALEVNGKIEEGTCLERERAREVFEGIVRRMQDPALLEWQPGGFFKCRVFPIEPRATKRVIVAYTQALPCFQGKMSYVYPLASEKTRVHPPEGLRIGVQARFSGGLAKIESPSHQLDVQRKNANEASLSFRAAHYRPNNDFVVTLEPAAEEVRIVSHKTDGEDGYFACIATPQGGGERTPSRYAFVLDASASISAPRLEVAKRLVRGMMERRIEGDRFEVLAHNIEVERSGEVDLRAANTFMDRLRPIGGSDVLQALLAAPADAEIVYIGKGAATFGESEPSKIIEAVKGRRIRTIAVGSDANLPLLERLGGMMRVHPNDDIAKRVAEIAATLGSPVLSDLKLEGGDAIYDVVGLRDLFFGERLIVSGRYRGAGSKLAIAGRGYRREVDVAFPPKEEGNNYVRRLWAQRKVSDLLAKGPSTKAEVTELGVKHQIMTPYTSFLVLETEQMWKDHQLKREVQKQDEVLGKGPEDPATKREVIRKVAQLLELSYKAAEQQRFDRVIQLSDEILKIDPRYPVALELKEEAEKSRHKEEYFSVWARKLEALKRETRGDGEPMLPKATSMKIPSREEWGQLVNKLTPSVIKTEGGASDAADPEVIVKRLEPLVVKPAPEAKPEPPPIVPNPPAPPDTTTNSLVIRTTPRNGDEDPRAKAIREAYEEQLRRDRQEVTINLRKDAGGEVVNEFRRQSGWNFTLDDATGQLGPGSPLTGAVWSEDLDGGVDTYTPFMRMRGGQQAYEFGYGGHAKVHYTLDHDAYDNPVDPTEIGPRRPAPGMDFFAPTLKVGQTLLDDSGGRTSGKAARINDYQRLLDQANTATAKYEADMQVFVRQGEVQLAQIQDLTKNVEEHRSKLAKSINEKSLKVDELHYARLMAERLQEDLARLEAKHAELARDSKMLDKKVTDDVSSLMVCVVAGTVMEVVTVSEDGSSITLKGAAVTPGQICAVTRAGSFVALVRVEQIGARVWQGLAVGRILPGDRADVVASPRTYLATLPEAVRLDLSSRAGQQAIRAKMGW